MWFAVLAMASCSPCHEAIVRSLAKPGMGQSISKPRAEAMLRQEGRHGASEWAVGWNGNVLIHRVDGQTVAVDWAVGSGHEGKSYLLRFGAALFQSPLAWYARRGRRDLSPGYPAGKSIDFPRPVTADCLFCHAGASLPIAGTVNRYAARTPIPEPGIGCPRCHGNSEAHVRDPRRGNIVNPARLAARERDSVCEQCHLSGVARIPLPGCKRSSQADGTD